MKEYLKSVKTASAIGLALATFSAGGAYAADIGETGDPHIDQQLRNELRWSGFYAGVAGVAGMTNTEVDAGFDGGPSAFLDGIGSEGLGLHGTVGYDQRLGRFVVGAFGDFTYSDDFWQTEFGVSCGADCGGTGEINREYDWTAGVRVGVLVNPATMVYGLAGYSQMKTSAPTFGGAAIPGTDSLTFDGYTVGAGLESKANDFVSWYVEGRWSEYDSETVAESGPLTVTAEPSEVKALVGAKIRLLTE